MRYSVVCLNCGHDFTTKVDHPQCSQCKCHEMIENDPVKLRDKADKYRRLADRFDWLSKH